MNIVEKKLRKIARELMLKKRCEERYIVERKIFPRLKGKKILSVGCASYVADYPHRLKDNEVWTMDIDPEVEKYGAKKHIIGSVADVTKYFEKDYFDVIFLLGVFGFGLYDKKEAEKTMKGCHEILKKNGLLMIWWSDTPGRNQIDPRKLKNFSLFKPVKAFGVESGHKTKKKVILEFLKNIKS